MSKPSLAALLATLLIGCSTAPLSHAADADGGVSADPQALAAGFLTHERGLVRPYCHAVLIGPTTALAAEACLDGTYPEALSFAVGNDPDYEIPVVGVLPSTGPGTVTLALDAPLEQGRPADLGDGLPPMGALIHATSFVHAASGDTPTPTHWTAEVIAAQEGRFVVELRDGAPGCHGDTGVAAFSENRVVGVLVGVRDGGPEHPISSVCATRFVFAPGG